MEYYLTMLPLILSIVVAFALGYGVRELISRHRHKKARDQQVLDQRDMDHFKSNELQLFGTNLGAARKRRRKVKKVALSDSDIPGLTE